MIKSLANRATAAAEILTKDAIVELSDREVAMVAGGALAKEQVSAR